MWRVYEHSQKDEDYKVYKEALNATNEVLKSKRKSQHKPAKNMISESQSFHAYLRSEKNVRDKVAPLEDNAGNTLTGISNSCGIK